MFIIYICERCLFYNRAYLDYFLKKTLQNKPIFGE